MNVPYAPGSAYSKPDKRKRENNKIKASVCMSMRVSTCVCVRVCACECVRLCVNTYHPRTSRTNAICVICGTPVSVPPASIACDVAQSNQTNLGVGRERESEGKRERESKRERKESP